MAIAAAVGEIEPDTECIIIDEAMGDVLPDHLEPDRDIIGLTANTSEANYAYALAVKFRERYPELPIVGGGPHFTFQTEEALHFFDVVFQGEAENTLPLFFADLKKGTLKPVYDGRQAAVRLDRPDFPVIEPKKSLQQPDEYGAYFLLTSRGCNNKCVYCAQSAFSGKGIRYLDFGRVEKWLENLPRKSALLVHDDNVISDRAHAIELAGILKAYGVPWTCQTNIIIGDDPELLKILGKSGCVMLIIGIESIEKKNLMSIGKAHINVPEHYSRQLENIRNIGGMGVYGEFMLGSDGFQYPDSVEKLMDWIRSKKAIEFAQITLETPLPGTRLREIRTKQNRILETGPYGKKISWNDYDLVHLTQTIPGLSAEEAQRTIHWLYGKFYGTNPLYTLRYLPVFLKTHILHGQSGFHHRLVGTVFPYLLHRGAYKVAMHKMETPGGRVNVKIL